MATVTKEPKIIAVISTINFPSIFSISLILKGAKNYALDKWIKGDAVGTALFNSVNGKEIATVSSKGLDFFGMMKYARTVGNVNEYNGSHKKLH